MLWKIDFLKHTENILYKISVGLQTNPKLGELNVCIYFFLNLQSDTNNNFLADK